MPSGNFARGLLPYLPGVAQNLSDRFENDRRRKAQDAFVQPWESAQAVPPVPMPEDAPDFNTEAATGASRAAVIKQGLLGPDWQKAALELGASPGQLLDFYKSLSPNEQAAFHRNVEQDKQKYWMGEDLPEHRRAIVESSLGIKKPEPKPVLPKTGLQIAEEGMSPEDWQRAARIKHGLEPKPENPPAPKTEKTVSPEDQFMSDVRAILPSIEKERVGKDASGNDVLIPLTFDERMQKAILKAQDLRGLARNAGVVQGPPAPVAGAGKAIPATVPATPTSADSTAHPEWFEPAVDVPEEIQAAAEEMQAAGIEMSADDLADPQFMEVYRLWKESQGAVVP